MFEELFTRRGTIASYHAAPLLDERLRYLRHCTQEGVGRPTLRQIAAHQLHLVHFLGLRKAERVGMPRIEAAAAQWLRRSQGRPTGPVRPNTRRVFVGRALRWLRLAPPAARPCSPVGFPSRRAGFILEPVLPLPGKDRRVEYPPQANTERKLPRALTTTRNPP